ncbi:Sec-independent protein translocase protein TatB [Marinimicrobium sp. C6131]|uniref:Sec-independent protein translocase protein TatB n=1 Tax=Marinimicrobium sp. C6131 TaxID=3022676 RepID=UPI00223D5C3B|nr:Sec-independent protein translocase protein TatB [Marinimicrobium sp. C6131]UZJ43228.1 Sec-independent protein translocase protein TatB [Marinimicrobium sp. C6131]
MFDIGFFELLIIAIVGLVVIGPERLPEAARAVGLWIGRLKRSLRETRSELEKQLGADDIRRQLHNEEVMRSLEATRRQVQEAVEEGSFQTPLKKYKDEDEPELPDHAHTESKDGDSSSNTGTDTGTNDADGKGTDSEPGDASSEPAKAPRDSQTPSS